jgi:DNA mismatch endonuclease (patch repair protein)
MILICRASVTWRRGPGQGYAILLAGLYLKSSDVVDITDPKTRSRMMSQIKGKNTKAEVAIRKRLFARGYRYRLHVKGLPGKPDIVFPGRRAVVFVNGCFWHHHDCHLFRMPSTREEWWREKLEGNRQRDASNRKKLLADDWRVMVVWECAWRKKDPEKEYDRIAESVERWLESDESTGLIPSEGRKK